MGADFHTYFVGCDGWGFSVWAHNVYKDVLGEDGVTVIKSKEVVQAEVVQMLQRVGYTEEAAIAWAANYATGKKESTRYVRSEDGSRGKVVKVSSPLDGNSLHAQLKAYIDAGGGPFQFEGTYTRPGGKGDVLPKHGFWTGPEGHSRFVPDDPTPFAPSLKPGEYVAYESGRPHFERWAWEGKTFTAQERLHGTDAIDGPIFRKTLAEEWGISASEAQIRLEQLGRSPHHSGGDTFQLIPWEIHGNRNQKIPGFSHRGGAYDRRSGNN